MSDHEEDDAVEEYYKNNPQVRGAILAALKKMNPPDDGPCTAGGIKYEVFQKHQESIRREQRRYEIARDVLAGQSTRQDLGTPEGEAQFAVRWADALLAELDKPQK